MLGNVFRAVVRSSPSFSPFRARLCSRPRLALPIFFSSCFFSSPSSIFSSSLSSPSPYSSSSSSSSSSLLLDCPPFDLTSSSDSPSTSTSASTSSSSFSSPPSYAPVAPAPSPQAPTPRNAGSDTMASVQQLVRLLKDPRYKQQVSAHQLQRLSDGEFWRKLLSSCSEQRQWSLFYSLCFDLLLPRHAEFGMDKIDSWTLSMIMNGLCAFDLTAVLRVFQLIPTDFKEQTNHDIQAYMGQVVQLLANAGRASDADALVQYSRSKLHVSPDIVTYNFLVDAWLKADQFPRALDCLRQMRNDKLDLNAHTFTILIEYHMKHNDVEKALLLFKEMDKNKLTTDIVCNVMINACLHRNDEKSALELYHLLKAHPEYGAVTDATLAPFISYYCLAGNAEAAEAMLDEGHALGCRLAEVLFVRVIARYGRTHRMDRAMQLIDKMKSWGMQPSSTVMNGLITGLAATDVDAAAKLLSEIGARGIHGDSFCYLSLMISYCRFDKVDKAEQLLEEMRRYNVPVNSRHYSCLVRAYANRNDTASFLRWVSIWQRDPARLPINSDLFFSLFFKFNAISNQLRSIPGVREMSHRYDSKRPIDLRTPEERAVVKRMLSLVERLHMQTRHRPQY